ncbi:hypothetical protein, partial [Sphingobium abikonense]|uniref:hypothetical protein n=1 Tax=Sphingobium abikonense TaxID=86193 RepID=UPI003519B906
MTMFRTVSGALTIYAGDPRPVHFSFFDAAGAPQSLSGRSFVFAVRRDILTQAIFVPIPMILSGDGYYVTAPITADQATAIYEAGVGYPIVYDVIETTAGASTTRWTGRIAAQPSTALPSDAPPRWIDLPVVELVSDGPVVRVSERGAAGPGVEQRLKDLGDIAEADPALMRDKIREWGGEGAAPFAEAAETAAQQAAEVVQEAYDTIGEVITILPSKADIILPVNYGASGDGVSPRDGAAILMAASAARLSGAPVVIDRPYLVDETLSFGLSPKLQFVGEGRFIQKPNIPTLRIGNPDAIYVAGQANMLAADAMTGSRTITLAPGKAANITAGTWLRIHSNSLAPGLGHTSKRAEHIFVEEVAGNNLIISGPLAFDYLVSAAAEVTNINLISGVEIDGFILEGADYDGISSGEGYYGIQIYGALRPKLFNMFSSNMYVAALSFYECIEAHVSRANGANHYSVDFTEQAGYGYMIHERGLNSYLYAEDICSERVRHTYTTTVDVGGIGVPLFSRFNGGRILNPRGAGLDTHPGAHGITFENFGVHGSRHVGIQSRSSGTKFKNIDITGSAGSGVLIEGTAEDTEVIGVSMRSVAYDVIGSTNHASRGAIWDAGRRTYGNDIRVDRCGGPLLQKGDSAGNTDATATWRNIRGKNICQSASVGATGRFGVGVVKDGLVGRFVIDGYEIDGGGVANYGVRVTSPNVTAEVSGGGSVRNVLLAAYSVKTSDIVHGGSDISVNNPGQRKDVTISGGIIDVSSLGSSFFNLRGEGGANDQLTQILGGRLGDKIILTATTEDITVIHDPSKINLAGASNLTLVSALDNLCLYCVGTNTWSY